MKNVLTDARPRAAKALPERVPTLANGAFIVLCLGFAKDGNAAQIAELKHALCTSPLVLRYLEASGAFDLVLEVAALDAASYYRWLVATTKPYGELIVREETCFTDEPLSESAAENVIWVPEIQGKIGLRCSAIDRIVAEGDYIRLHAEGRSWQVHATLHSYEELLAGHGFVRVHRSTLVRAGAVRRMARAGGHWFVELRDGNRERVARNRVAETKAALNDLSPNKDHLSSMR